MRKCFTFWYFTHSGIPWHINNFVNLLSVYQTKISWWFETVLPIQSIHKTDKSIFEESGRQKIPPQKEPPIQNSLILSGEIISHLKYLYNTIVL